MGEPLELSLSQPYELRLPGITYNLDGGSADPRSKFTPQFQLLAPGTTNFGAWTNGEWEDIAPPSGPFGARITIGAGQPAPVNPGVAGTYRVWIRYYQTASGAETPAFRCGLVTLAAP